MINVEGLSNGGFALTYGKYLNHGHTFGYVGYLSFYDSNSNLVSSKTVSYRTHSMDLIALESGGAGVFTTYGTSYGVIYHGSLLG